MNCSKPYTYKYELNFYLKKNPNKFLYFFPVSTLRSFTKQFLNKTVLKYQIMKRVQLKIEFILRASPTIVYNFLTHPACLVRWFCDKVDIDGEMYTFEWNKSKEWAELLDDIEEEYLRFRFDSAETDDEFLEFRISTSPITDETILEISEWCDETDLSDQKLYWENLVQRMQREMGA